MQNVLRERSWGGPLSIIQYPQSVLLFYDFHLVGELFILAIYVEAIARRCMAEPDPLRAVANHYFQPIIVPR
jgi:hypothetical protein